MLCLSARVYISVAILAVLAFAGTFLEHYEISVTKITDVEAKTNQAGAGTVKVKQTASDIKAEEIDNNKTGDKSQGQAGKDSSSKPKSQGAQGDKFLRAPNKETSINANRGGAQDSDNANGSHGTSSSSNTQTSKSKAGESGTRF